MLRSIDNHAHLNFKDFEKDLEDVVARAKEAGVGIVNVGTDIESSRKAVELSEKYENMWAVIGQHPTDTEEEFVVEAYCELLKSSKVIAIGECGLDYFHLKEGDENKQKEDQKRLFKSQIELALEAGKPLMLHIRPASAKASAGKDAYEDALEVLKDYPEVRGNVHFFAGGREIAKEFLDLGFTLSFTGVITFAKEYEELIKFVPLDRILSETDCPFVSPVPYRGKRNEPVHVIEVVKKIAEIKNMTLDEVSGQLLQNSKNLWKI